jgi:hypothetical protein
LSNPWDLRVTDILSRSHTHPSDQDLLHPNLALVFSATKHVQVVGLIFEEREIISGFDSEYERLRRSVKACDKIGIEVGERAK